MRGSGLVDRFHVLALVEGDEVAIEAASGDRHGLHYAETIVIPAAVRTYTIHNRGEADCMVLKAFVR